MIVRAVGQIGNTVEGKIETKTFEDVLQEQLAEEPVDLRQCGIEMANAAYQGCTKAVAWKTCANQAFGLAGWANQETLNGTSGWRRGGYNQGGYCTEFINSVIQTRGLDDVPHLVDDVKSSEENRRTGWMNTVSEYNYYCSIKLHWNPVYNQKADPICGQE